MPELTHEEHALSREDALRIWRVLMDDLTPEERRRPRSPPSSP
jgi:hypothetical protein